MTNDQTSEAKTLEEFRSKLKDILSSDRVKRIINNLMSYATNCEVEASS
jgi:hypothetical protein